VNPSGQAVIIVQDAGMFNLRSLLLSSCVSLCLSTQAQAETLFEAVDDLVTHHPQIEASKQTALGMAENVKRSWGAYLPTVELSADTGFERINSPARRAANLDPYGRNRNTYTLTVTQTLWNGGARDAEYASAIHQHNAATQNAESTAQNIIFEGIATYLDVLRQDKLVKLATQNEANIRRQLQLEDERVRRGSGITVDVLQAKTRLQLAKERRVAFEGALEGAFSRYLQVFGKPAVLSEMEEPTPPLSLIPETLEAAVEFANKENPIILARLQDSMAMQENRNVSKAAYMPTVDLVLEHGYENGADGTIGTHRDYTALVTATWTLFNGFQNRSEVQKASFDFAASRATYRYTQRKTEEQTRLAWQQLETARKRVELLNNAVNIAGEVFESRKKLRESGKETALTVLDAENEVYNARINHTAAMFDMKRGVYQLLLAMGELRPDEMRNK